jgi:anti-sigma factor RsiW
MTCEWSSLIEAYHDGELAAEQRPALEAHLSQCGPCSAELADLHSFSRLFSEANWPAMSSEALSRLHDRWHDIQDRGVLRIAEWLTAAAAAVLLFGILGIWRQPSTYAGQLAPWENAAISQTHLEMESRTAMEVAPVADWREMSQFEQSSR